MIFKSTWTKSFRITSKAIAGTEFGTVLNEVWGTLDTDVRHHLVILHDSYLRLMLSGRKRIECRLSSIRRPPFESVAPGDLLWFKVPSGPVAAVGAAGQCRFQRLRGGSELDELLREHSNLICAADGFFKDAARWARYASLIWLDWVAAIGPMRVVKSDQRAWVPLSMPPFPGMRIDASQLVTSRT